MYTLLSPMALATAASLGPFKNPMGYFLGWRCKACVRAGLATGLFSSLPTPLTLPLTPPTPQGSAHALLPSPFLHVTLFLVVKDT